MAAFSNQAFDTSCFSVLAFAFPAVAGGATGTSGEMRLHAAACISGDILRGTCISGVVTRSACISGENTGSARISGDATNSVTFNGE